MSVFKRDNIVYFKAAFIILLAAVFFYKGFIVFYEKWFWWGSYYTHGPLVLIAFILLLQKRLKYHKSHFEKKSSPVAGGVITIFAIAIYLFGLWKNGSPFILWGIFIFVVGTSISLFGRYFLIKNIGIYVYLLLAVPVPQIIIDHLTFELNLFASYASELFLSIIYPSTVRNGNELIINGYSILITHECSGLSNLISMFSVVWLMALVQHKKIISIIDYLISIPAALISNILRIIIISILVVNGHEQFALYDWHYEIGIGVFIVTVVVIALFNEFPVSKKIPAFKISSEKMISHFKTNKNFINLYVISFLILCFFSISIAYQKKTVVPSNEILLKDIIPSSIGNWQSKDEAFAENYYEVLGTNDLFMRSYREKRKTSENDNIYLYIIRSRKNISAFHRPEVCLRGEGYNLVAHNDINLVINNNHVIPVQRMLFVDRNQGLLVYYWYNINGKNVKDTIKYQLSFLFNLNEDSSGSFIRISKPVNLNNITQEEDKMKQFARDVTPEIWTYL